MKFPKFVKDKEFMSLIKLMLYKNIDKRIGRLSQIKSHPYFLSFKWDSLNDLTMEPCYKIHTEPITSKDHISYESYLQVN